MKRSTVLLLTPGVLLPCGLLALAGLAGGPGKTERRPVYVASGLSSEQLIALTANVAAGGAHGVVLQDAPASREYLKAFLQAYRPSEIFLVGTFPGGNESVATALAAKEYFAVTWRESMPPDMWKTLFAKAAEVVVCAREPRRLLLQAACLAGAAHAPFFVLEGRAHEEAELRGLLKNWGTRTVHAVGAGAAQVCGKLATVNVQQLPSEEAVMDAYVQRLLKKRPDSDTGHRQSRRQQPAQWRPVRPGPLGRPGAPRTLAAHEGTR